MTDEISPTINQRAKELIKRNKLNLGKTSGTFKLNLDEM
jgi:hypothetical protein